MMHTLATVATVLAALLAVSAQQYQQAGGNYVDDYAQYDSQQPSQPTPRSYATNEAPARQSAAPANPKPTPVAILKQINRHNEDGSYTYGFEGADGSFKIETKLPTGDVKGKYGFVDDTGKVRIVEYGANQYGFQPAGDGITVAPPTLFDETTSKEALDAQAYEEYQQRQQQQQQAAARPAYQPPPSQSHTQAVYAPAQVAPSRPALPKPPIFTPAAAQEQQRSQLVQHNPAYDEPAPASQLYNQGPAQFGPAPNQERRAQPQARSGSGILDQLARDYALPQGVAPPLHDISFGYY
ncbi:RNA polymerase II degradation factor 1-like [Formica exsecta]|uniref:RNA polymerase II degradation factor 1-like n=1 Tax=Formica exsecta TaxID=72781 RepID=UPI001143BC74|nr:RNA polymerase II degradation factor 1-like [Formica exsecta]